MIHEVLSQAL
jgi:dihydroneopterin aldolase